MFGILLSSNILSIGQTYSFTFESGEWFFFDNTGEIQAGLNERMANLGEIVSVTRSLFSDRYIVIVVPTNETTLGDWLSAFDVSWRDIGYDNIIFITAEGGILSTQPGGIAQVIPQVGEVAASTLASTLKPLLPYALAFLGLYLAITMLPILTTRRRHARSN